ncbi:TonB-dependent receptor [Allomuricauda taeanensis]|uniref:TonB-dependent receptor n=1 Tax=Flagellimonas taeanensis TaxID=1005926 RepID=UPI002E7C0EFA|nr:TonB-dependent receptor [Allomuricauda taeanensis]MEE1963945.1 TonB-dependent receptor [Allomuricauda taeanensis]
MRKFIFFLFFPTLFFAQNNGFNISGTITGETGETVAFANVTLDRDNKYAVSDENGRYHIQNVRRGDYVITISSLGFETITRNISVNNDLVLDFTMRENVENLEDVTITGQKTTTAISQKAIAISSLDIKQVADQSLGAEEVLKTSTGIVVRQSGGLGSELNINLNGLTGQAVRIYYDGIPLQVYGNGLQLNNVPVDALERVDVYKGVMPVDIGTDALGGGINLVPIEPMENSLRASYSVGSFNTHRVTLNANKQLGEKTSLSLLSYFNQSDNDYRMKNIPNLVENLNDEGDVVSVSEETIDTDRFHNKHTSAFIQAALHLKDRSWADKFVLASSFSHRFDEIQQGAVIISTSIGEAEQKISGFSQRLDYQKKLFQEKVNLRYYGVLSYAVQKSNDSTTSIYNWKGEKLQTTNSTGAEIFSIPTLREGRDLGTAHRVTLNTDIADNLSLKVSNYFRFSRIKGEDPVGIRLDIDGEEIDPNTVPSKLSRNILGAELEHRSFGDRLTTIVFYKNYQYTAESIDFLLDQATVLPIRKVNENNNGYGLALKYQLTPSFFVRGSFENAVRIPTETEVFGDFNVILPNYTLQPEKSRNINAGFSYANQIGQYGFVSFKIDGFLREREDLIRLDRFGLENLIFVNEDAVDGKGVEFASQVTPIKNLDISANLTYQSNEIARVGGSGSQSSVGVQVPNIPRFFYNVGANHQIDNVFKSNNTLKLFWTYFFTDRFSINEVANLDTANPMFVIPEQNLHNAGLTYILEDKGLSFSFNVQNVFNEEIFDNFRIPRPGINYAFKINYSL